ncbi:flagellar hook-basal body complex protein [Aminipila butyrica]|uniref:Flagellar hook protein FlgE n=1 Tax=Aminipila butyrica TaxID=433296 RepID=A0A858BS23_9FIRM|nr:flagellar hook-basal body complex protein [Aminipila butyrica]QIB68377.1 flagellar hook-basal body complex protein [Aminipila butyrica]
MVKSMFAAVAGLRAHQAKMDVIGNNIANVNTYGYKAARATFRDVFYATSSGAGNAGTVYGGTNPSQVGYGSKLGSIDSLMTSGGTATTDSPLDCMIVGNGFFLVGQMPEEAAGVREGIDVESGYEDDGSKKDNAKLGEVDQTKVSALSLTRVGIFNFDGDGNLVDSNGRLVYGFASEYKTDGGTDGKTAGYELNMNEITAIRLPNASTEAGTYEPMTLKKITVGQDGGITGTNDKGESILIAKIAIANVPNPNALERGENSYYTAKANTGTITVNPSGQNSTGEIQSGCLEMSNVDLSREFTDMITTERGFQANTRIITVTDSMLEELVNLKR